MICCVCVPSALIRSRAGTQLLNKLSVDCVDMSARLRSFTKIKYNLYLEIAVYTRLIWENTKHFQIIPNDQFSCLRVGHLPLHSASGPHWQISVSQMNTKFEIKPFKTQKRYLQAGIQLVPRLLLAKTCFTTRGNVFIYTYTYISESLRDEPSQCEWH